MKLDAEIKTRIPKELKKQMRRAAREEARRSGIPVSLADFTREAVAERVTKVLKPELA